MFDGFIEAENEEGQKILDTIMTKYPDMFELVEDDEEN